MALPDGSPPVLQPVYSSITNIFDAYGYNLDSTDPAELKRCPSDVTTALRRGGLRGWGASVCFLCPENNHPFGREHQDAGT